MPTLAASVFSHISAPHLLVENSFFSQKGAVAGVFTAIGIACATLIFVIAFAIRRRRWRRSSQTRSSDSASDGSLNRIPLDGGVEHGNNYGNNLSGSQLPTHLRDTMKMIQVPSPVLIRQRSPASGAGQSEYWMSSDPFNVHVVASRGVHENGHGVTGYSDDGVVGSGVTTTTARIGQNASRGGARIYQEEYLRLRTTSSSDDGPLADFIMVTSNPLSPVSVVSGDDHADDMRTSVGGPPDPHVPFHPRPSSSPTGTIIVGFSNESSTEHLQFGDESHCESNGEKAEGTNDGNFTESTQNNTYPFSSSTITERPIIVDQRMDPLAVLRKSSVRSDSSTEDPYESGPSRNTSRHQSKMSFCDGEDYSRRVLPVS